ncbi:DUF167 domain-containing protein [Geovibrio thiophilus]|uniref:UPF0235 protein EP073_12630 n=1 Tax=Geovibrio thiophilus TaxID=139438 RepID=A0A3R5Z0T9_9BACT|nr:DUF167 domain-containing protein [Geovibrio thiophilus]QAR34219.1 DUF167 domain-containing protein [Geovibrio thiophilus]
MKFHVYIQPGAKKSGYAGEFDGKAKIKVAAPPVEGAANDAVVRFFAKTLKLPKSAVRICAGGLSRHKTLEIDAELSESEILEAIRRRS